MNDQTPLREFVDQEVSNWGKKVKTSIVSKLMDEKKCHTIGDLCSQIDQIDWDQILQLNVLVDQIRDSLRQFEPKISSECSDVSFVSQDVVSDEEINGTQSVKSEGEAVHWVGDNLNNLNIDLLQSMFKRKKLNTFHLRSQSVPVNAINENTKQLSKSVSIPKRRLSELYDMIDSICVSEIDKEKPRLQLMFIGAPNESTIAKEFSDALINDFVSKDRVETANTDILKVNDYSLVESDLDLFKDRVQWQRGHNDVKLLKIEESTKYQVLLSIAQKMSQAEEGTIIYYSGNAQLGTGDWPTSKPDENIGLQDIVDLIQKKKYRGYVCLELDCCFAGQWVEKATKMHKIKGLENVKVWIKAICSQDRTIQWGAVQKLIQAKTEYGENSQQYKDIDQQFVFENKPIQFKNF